MVNESVRTRQYREYLDADKHISRQIYNLYQRQESAYNEGTPSIRNQNQLAPISGVIEAVSAFQTELQTLLGNAANSYFQIAQNFIPTVKTYNAVVSALRSIQNIYTKDVQIKYEVDKLLRPVIDLLQSLGAQLAFDPAVSNRLFQMRTNLLSKVYERVDFNVGKRNIVKSEGNTNTVNIQTSQPNSGQQDTFQAPVQYDPVSNDPFLGKEAIKPEPPATLYGLATDGINLSNEEPKQLKDWVEFINDVISAPQFWVDKLLSDWLSGKKNPIKKFYSASETDIEEKVKAITADFKTEYDALPEKVQTVLEKNQFGTQKIEDVNKLLSRELEELQGKTKVFLDLLALSGSSEGFWLEVVKKPLDELVSMNTSKIKEIVKNYANSLKEEYNALPENAKTFLTENGFPAKQIIEDKNEALLKELQKLKVSYTAEKMSKAQQPRAEKKERKSQKEEKNKNQRQARVEKRQERQQQQQQQQSTGAPPPPPLTTLRYDSFPTTPSTPPPIQPTDFAQLNDGEMKTFLASQGVQWKQIRADDQFEGKSWADRTQSIRQKLIQNPKATTAYLNYTYGLKLPAPKKQANTPSSAKSQQRAPASPFIEDPD